VLIGVAAFCHAFMLTNDGRIWDSWFVVAWLKAKEWPAINEFFSSVGLPLYAVIYWPFAYVGNIVGAFMWATFLCLLASGILTYRLGIGLGFLGNGEALAVAAFSVAMPLFLAAQDCIMFFFIFTHTVFLAAALLAVLALDAAGWRHWVLRGVAVAAFLMCFSNAGLLVFYGALYIVLFARYRAIQDLPLAAGAFRFGTRFPDLLALPPVAWVCRGYFTPQYGWYEHYNSIGANLHKVGDSLWSFAKYVVPFHFWRTLGWPIDHPFITVLMIAAVVAWVKWAPRNWQTERSSVTAASLAAFGVGSLFLAVFPYAVAGKHFIANPVGEDSHHLLLTGLPAAVLVFAAMRPLLWWKGAYASRTFAPVCACTVVILGSQVTPEYVAERAEWVFCRSLLHNAAHNDIVRESSVIFIPDKFSLTKQHVYEIYGFAGAFGGVNRFVTHHVPWNRSFYMPPEILNTLVRTTVIPNEFKRINPAGQQILLKVDRNGGGKTDWDIALRYLRLSWFGSASELAEFLSGLTILQTQVLKPATPLTPAWSRDGKVGFAPKAGPPSKRFTNGVGMQMISLPWGWWAGEHEVTQQAFERVMASNPSLFKDAGRPVECVSWNEAANFCRRLSVSEEREGRLPSGFIYRLPTTSEHEQFSAGALPNDAVMSFAKVQWHTEAVGTTRPNSLGLHDTIGNVWEWCLDWASDAKQFKVSAGGGWANVIGDLQPRAEGWNKSDPYERAAADRLFGLKRRDYPDQGFWDRGFRVVLARAIEEPVMRGN